jgi:bifunctional enzyme CysN/CysC
VLASFISPFRSERELARSRLAPGEFIEVHVDVPLAVAEARDAKGLYARARRGELPHFTGIDSPYEPPEAPEIHLAADRLSVQQAASAVMHWLSAQGLLTA